MKLLLFSTIAAAVTVLLWSTPVLAEDVLETCSIFDFEACRGGTSCTFVNLSTMRCMPDRDFFASFNDPTKKDHYRCSKFFRRGKIKNAIDSHSTKGMAAGSSFSAGATSSNEIGLAYTRDGSVACYKQTCSGVSASVGASFTATQIITSKRQMDCPSSGKVCKEDTTIACENNSDCNNNDLGNCVDCIKFKEGTHVFSTGVSFGLGLSGTAVYPNDITSANPIATAITVSGGVSVSAAPGAYAQCNTKVIHGGSLRWLIAPNNKYLAAVNDNNMDVDFRSNPDEAGKSEWLIIPYIENQDKYLIYNPEKDRFLRNNNPLELEKMDSGWNDIKDRHVFKFTKEYSDFGEKNRYTIQDDTATKFLAVDSNSDPRMANFVVGEWILDLVQD